MARSERPAPARPAFDPAISKGLLVSSWSGPYVPRAGDRCVTCRQTRFWSPWPEGQGMLCRFCRGPDSGTAIVIAIDTRDLA